MFRRLGLSVTALAATMLLVVPAPAVAGPTGFDGPVFGIDFAPNGDLLVADAGAGIVSVSNGDRDTLALPGVTDVSSLGRKMLWATRTTATDPTTDSGQALFRVTGGNAEMVVNLFQFEETVNPDGGPVDSNPFDVEAVDGGSALVVDAGGNDLLRVDRHGSVDVLATFPTEVVPTDNIKDLADCPPEGSPDFPCNLPPAMPAEAVPTSVAIGPDGDYYVSELKGFPAPTGESRIWRVSPDASWAQCGSSPDCQVVFDGGFTSIIDLTFGPDGSLYVAEFDEASWAAVEIFHTPAGGTINRCDVTSSSCVEVATDLNVLTAIAFEPRGELWAVINALTPPATEIIEIT